MHSRSMMLAALVVSLCIVPAAATHAGPPKAEAALAALRERIVPGRIETDITSAADPHERYAVYLPSGYTGRTALPVLFLLDPRGRALVPLELFVDAAERRGWILISSYNTASDIPRDANTPAMQAMLWDASRLFRLDATRAYIAGFSGTARAAWSFARALGSTAAGVIGFGGGLPAGEQSPHDAQFAFYGAAGFTDYNYLEMNQLDKSLHETNITHRFEYFPGPHSWGPADVCARALDWMELQGMRSGRRPFDEQVVTEILAARIAEARAWEAPEPEGAGDADGPAAIEHRCPHSFEALQRYTEIVEDFDGLVGGEQLASTTARIAELEASSEGCQTLALATQLAVQVGVRQLQASARDTSRPARALAAQRTIEALYIEAAFYQPREAAWAGEFVRALRFLQLADILQPGTARVPLMMAAVHAQLGDAEAAVGELRRAHAIVPLTGGQLRGDSELDPIRQTPEFREFMGQLTAAR